MKLTLKLVRNKRQRTIPITLERVGTKWKVIAPFNRWLVDELRVMEGAKAEFTTQGEFLFWTVAASERNTYSLKVMGGWVDPNYYTVINDGDKRATTILINDLDYPLFWWQKENVEFILQHKRVEIADPMGLGKTLTIIALMKYLAIHNQVVDWWLVAPPGAQKEWQKQLKFWNSPIIPSVITTAESLRKWIEAADHPPEGIIIDESIKIKTPTSARSIAAKQICDYIRARPGGGGYIINLSGEPANTPVDWWHQIECLQPGFLREGNVHKFRDRLAKIEMQSTSVGTFPKVIGWKKAEVIALGRRLRPIVLRHEKKDCLDLPDKIYEVIEHHPSKATMKLAKLLTRTCSTATVLAEKLRELSDGFQYKVKIDRDQICGTRREYTWIGSPKMNTIKDLLDFYKVENGGPGRLVIYAWFRAIQEQLVKVAEAQDWEVYNIGSKWSEPDALDLFQCDKQCNRLIVANPASVHGLTLTKTLALVYYDNPFNLDYRTQSEDRRDRPGMSNQGTRILDLCHLPTDQYILSKLRAGKQVAEITFEELVRVINQQEPKDDTKRTC